MSLFFFSIKGFSVNDDGLLPRQARDERKGKLDSSEKRFVL
jgi:hypothetical protein